MKRADSVARWVESYHSKSGVESLNDDAEDLFDCVVFDASSYELTFWKFSTTKKR